MVGQSAGTATDGNTGSYNAGNGHANAHSDGYIRAGTSGGRSYQHAGASFVAYSLMVEV
jgi:hypothetical protein